MGFADKKIIKREEYKNAHVISIKWRMGEKNSYP